LSEKQSNAVDIQGLDFSYNGFMILQDVDLTINLRDFVSVVGPNGGGKTTLLKIILGLLKPTSGTVQLFGANPSKSKKRVGYMPQHAKFDFQFPATVMDVALMGRLGNSTRFGPYTKHDREICMHKLEQVKLAHSFRKSFASLSGGQRQRVFIARALACEPDLLLLDEPTSNLDQGIESEVYELFQELNRTITIVLVSHDLGFVSRYVKRVVCVKRRVVTHPTTEITGALINAIYGAPMKMVRHDRHDCEGTGSCHNF
jgi:zinc transport system ATP-binding protein